MELYRYLEKVAQTLDTMTDREQINKVMDEVEFLYETLDPEFQHVAEDLIARLKKRHDALS